MEITDNQSLPPSSSQNLLRCIIGKRVVRLTRYSWWPPKDVAGECGIENSDAFSLTYGPLGIEFDNGAVIGVGEQPSLNSVVVWLDQAVGSQPVSIPTLDADPDVYPIEADDLQFSRKNFGEVVGDVLEELSILKVRSKSATLNAIPSELGLCFKFVSGRDFIASRSLHKESGDFAIIGWDQISPSIRSEIIEIPLMKAAS